MPGGGAQRLPLLVGGFMGVGKSTVGRAVATRTGTPFVDLDERIAARAGRAIPSIFRDLGEPAFRAFEREALREVLDEPGARVVALGGGALLDPATRRDALDRARVVTLVARTETILKRTAGPGRPLLEGATDPAQRIRVLLDARAAAYAEAHAQITTDGTDVAAAAAAVCRAWDDRSVVVPLGPRSYAVRIAEREMVGAADIAAALHASGVFVITDDVVGPLWGDGLRAALVSAGLALAPVTVLPAGERHKTLTSVTLALEAMVEAGADRDAVVIAHGGGVVSDTAGFSAATLLRGVRWISIPTTLLAMVDASVGGKTGVDLGAAKNAVGAFHQPSGVFACVSHVRTESARAFASGLAEVVKAAAIADPELFELLEREAAAVLARDASLLGAIVERSVRVKADIVARDERESGDRALLNFGHTLGHALEAAGGYSRWTHGEAVALGMGSMLRAGRAEGRTDAGAAERVIALLERLGLPTRPPPDAVREALGLLRLDKKRRGNRIRIVWLRSLGQAFIDPLPIDDIERLFAATPA